MQLLKCSVVPAGELLTSLPEALAASVVELHTASTAGTLPPATRKTAGQAFASLVKLLVTSSGGGVAGLAGAGQQAQEQQRAAERALQQLRCAWKAAAPSLVDAAAGAAASHEDAVNSQGASLLAAVVEVVDGQVFPRQQATRQVQGHGRGWRHGSIQPCRGCIAVVRKRLLLFAQQEAAGCVCACQAQALSDNRGCGVPAGGCSGYRSLF